MAAGIRRARRPFDIWPGFVDALATLLILIIFVLMVFMVAHFYLTTTLSGREKALTRLNQRISELAEMLALEQNTSQDLRKSMAEIAVELQSAIESRDEAAGRAGELRATLLAVETRAAETGKELEAVGRAAAAAESRVLEALRDLKAERGALTASEARVAETQKTLESERSALAAVETRAAETRRALEAERTTSAEARALMELLNRQVAALRAQLRGVQAALDASDAEVKGQKLKIADLGRRLNVALAAKVQELKSYRSEFFGRLRGILGKRTDVRIVGDRFVFQSEVLFPTGSARLEPGGRAQLAKLAHTLQEISGKIPEGIDWVLRVDGHTDRRPISTAEFPSNWELSTARALSVVRFLVSQGIPPARLAATGFGEFQPLEGGDTETAYGKNRRIELKLTQR